MKNMVVTVHAPARGTPPGKSYRSFMAETLNPSPAYREAVDAEVHLRDCPDSLDPGEAAVIISQALAQIPGFGFSPGNVTWGLIVRMIEDAGFEVLAPSLKRPTPRPGGLLRNLRPSPEGVE